jgi:hypothetical protein
MPNRRLSGLIVALLATAGTLCFAPATAQFGLYNLPNNNFIWNWGTAGESAKRRGTPDLDLDGGEAGFQCHLTARFRISADLSPTDVRQLEGDLRTRMDFIYATATTMNYYDQMRQIDWATLDCKRPEPGPVDDAKRAERESAARQKMLKELERRRARQSQDDTKD